MWKSSNVQTFANSKECTKDVLLRSIEKKRCNNVISINSKAGVGISICVQMCVCARACVRIYPYGNIGMVNKLMAKSCCCLTDG